MILRTGQLEAMSLAITVSMRTRITRRILTEFPNCSRDTCQLSDEVSKMIEDVAPLGITLEDDLYRLLRFQILSASLMSSPVIAGAVYRILNIVRWPAQERLSFLEKQILSRIKPIQ